MATFDALPHYVELPAELENTRKYSHMLAMCCDLHEVNSCPGPIPGIQARLLQVPLGGLVSSVGPSGGFFQDYYDFYLSKFFEIYAEMGGDIPIGRMHKEVRNALLDEHPDDPLMLLFCKTIPLLGDPTTKLGGPLSSQYLAVEEESPRKSSFALERPVPNPFNPTVTLSFSISEPTRVSLCIYDVQGRLVRRLVDRVIETGQHRVRWDGKDERGRVVGSGVYFCRLSSRVHEETQKMVLLK